MIPAHGELPFHQGQRLGVTIAMQQARTSRWPVFKPYQPNSASWKGGIRTSPVLQRRRHKPTQMVAGDGAMCSTQLCLTPPSSLGPQILPDPRGIKVMRTLLIVQALCKDSPRFALIMYRPRLRG